MTQKTLEQQLQREARERFMELDDFGAEKLDTIIATTIQRVREEERKRINEIKRLKEPLPAVIMTAKEAVAYNKAIDDVLATLTDPLKYNPE